MPRLHQPREDIAHAVLYVFNSVASVTWNELIMRGELQVGVKTASHLHMQLKRTITFGYFGACCKCGRFIAFSYQAFLEFFCISSEHFGYIYKWTHWIQAW